MQIYFALLGNLAHFYLGTWHNFVWEVGFWLINHLNKNDFFLNRNTLRCTRYKNIKKSRIIFFFAYKKQLKLLKYAIQNNYFLGYLSFLILVTNAGRILLTKKEKGSSYFFIPN